MEEEKDGSEKEKRGGRAFICISKDCECLFFGTSEYASGEDDGHFRKWYCTFLFRSAATHVEKLISAIFSIEMLNCRIKEAYLYM